MEEILNLALKQCEAAEVFSYSDEEIPVEFESNRLKNIESNQSTVIALRIIKDGRVGYGVTTNSEEPEKLVTMAVETAEFGMKARFELPSPQQYLPVKTYDAAIEKITIEDMVKLGQELIDTVTKASPEIICDAGISRHSGNITILNSNGLQAKSYSGLFSFGIGGTLVRGTDMLFVGDGKYSSHPVYSGKDVVSNVLRQLEWAKDQTAISSKTMPVVFTPHGVENALIAPLVSAFNGKMVLEGASPLKGKLGTKLFSPDLSIIDDATSDFEAASSPFDDEGIATRAMPLINQGTVENFYYDLHTAALAGTVSTGNGNRSGGSLPSPGINALIIKGGDTSFEEMISDIKEGLIIEQLMGGEQGNILGGDFSGNVLLGYKIEDGKIAGRVKNTMIHGNVYKILKDIAAIGNDGRWVGSSLHTPSIYCHEISVASK
ncbi:MAG: TldD/PmbA family protein [Dehalococcoidales bacterium]|jgi:PmbA protein|nr:TldD/PmbA family protein [Dehalococcoidales bacterium]MDX9986027.1 TldD/PmbA family protein [Dehalococcoidales bacterium]NLE90234.1 TldD/PmbA family protein [Dehalococcoidales bacterium]